LTEHGSGTTLGVLGDRQPGLRGGEGSIETGVTIRRGPSPEKTETGYVPHGVVGRGVSRVAGIATE